jgi:hypothetical protein
VGKDALHFLRTLPTQTHVGQARTPSTVPRALKIAAEVKAGLHRGRDDNLKQYVIPDDDEPFVYRSPNAVRPFAKGRVFCRAKQKWPYRPRCQSETEQKATDSPQGLPVAGTPDRARTETPGADPAKAASASAAAEIDKEEERMVRLESCELVIYTVCSSIISCICSTRFIRYFYIYISSRRAGRGRLLLSKPRPFP